MPPGCCGRACLHGGGRRAGSRRLQSDQSKLLALSLADGSAPVHMSRAAPETLNVGPGDTAPPLAVHVTREPPFSAHLAGTCSMHCSADPSQQTRCARRCSPPRRVEACCPRWMWRARCTSVKVRPCGGQIIQGVRGGCAVGRFACQCTVAAAQIRIEVYLCRTCRLCRTAPLYRATRLHVRACGHAWQRFSQVCRAAHHATCYL